jgi:4-alpha-glucanotransferase
METAELSVWQMLPTTEPLMGLSPYQSVSAFAMNPALLPDDWLALFEVYQQSEQTFEQFKQNSPHWLEDYVLFMGLRLHFEYQTWSDWPEAYRDRDAKALNEFSRSHAEYLDFLRKQQYVLYRLWLDFKRAANDKGIQLFGDMPIFVAYDSADVWANPQDFKLDENKRPTVVAGVPPDYFSETGQRWGNPHYDWERMRQNGFDWWVQRMAAAEAQYDLIRLDHFRGLEAVWEIPAEAEDARTGTWVKVPGDELLATLQEKLGKLPIVAEDLGVITPEVEALRDKYHLPGMSVLQFGFDGLPGNPHAFGNIKENRVVYTGTHDNDTLMGWWQSLDDGMQNWVKEVVVQQNNHAFQQMPWDFIEAGMRTPAKLFMAPMQDFLALGSEARMNVPGVAEGNWTWQFQWQEVPQDLSERIRVFVEATQRTLKKSKKTDD